MKISVFLLMSLVSTLGSSQQDSTQLKFKSVQLDAFGSSIWYKNSNYTDIQSFYRNQSDYQSVLGLDSSYYGQSYSGTSGSSGVILKIGFTPYSKSKQQYLKQQEIVFGVGYTSYYSPRLDKYYSTNTVIDSIITYSISESTGDTINTEKSYLDSVNTYSEHYHYFTQKIMMYGEWNLTFFQKKKSSFSIGLGARLSYLYGGWLAYHYSNSYFYDNPQIYNYSHQSNSNELARNYGLYKSQNGIGFAPYLKLNYGLKLSKKDNFLSHFSIEANTFIGGSFHKIFKRQPIISELLYGVGIGLKYSI